MYALFSRFWILSLFLSLACGEENPASHSSSEQPPKADCRQWGHITEREEDGNLVLVGQIYNYGDAIAYFVQVTATFFDDERNAIGVENRYIDGYNFEVPGTGISTRTCIPPGLTATWKIDSGLSPEEAISYDFIITWEDY